MPLGRRGGDTGNKDLVAGTELYGPLWVKGAGLKNRKSHIAQFSTGTILRNGVDRGHQ